MMNFKDSVVRHLSAREQHGAYKYNMTMISSTTNWSRCFFSWPSHKMAQKPQVFGISWDYLIQPHLMGSRQREKPPLFWASERTQSAGTRHVWQPCDTVLIIAIRLFPYKCYANCKVAGGLTGIVCFGTVWARSNARLPRLESFRRSVTFISAGFSTYLAQTRCTLGRRSPTTPMHFC